MTPHREVLQASCFRADIFHGQVVWVTGGGSGIGREIARRFAALGAHCIVSGRRPEPLRETVELIRAEGGRARECVLDIRDNPWLTAKEDLEATRIRLFEIDDILATATVITKTKHKTILLGDTVTIEFMGKKENFTLVSSIEANPKKNFLSVDSPIGKEILHNKPGDIVFVKTPVGKISVKILTKS